MMEANQKEVHNLAGYHFDKADFNVFDIQGLDERMAGIRDRIQPKFRHFAEAGAHLIVSEAGPESVPDMSPSICAAQNMRPRIPGAPSVGMRGATRNIRTSRSALRRKGSASTFV